ncbi:hypothetical protein CerSpe_195400 [Prunus speciosa]
MISLLKRTKRKGWDTPIHVDAASGGFIAPFLYPDLEWDFRFPLVKSINVSGHKYGLLYAGVGWVVWRSKEDLPDKLVFHINYLGSDQPTFTLNFSEGSSQIIAQYYQFIRLGFEGYKNVMENCMKNTRFLREGLQKLSQPLKMLAAFRVSVHHFCSEIVTVDQSFNCDGRSGIEDKSLESDVDKFCEAIMDNSNAYCNMEKALDHVGLPLTTPLVVGGASRASF